MVGRVEAFIARCSMTNCLCRWNTASQVCEPRDHFAHDVNAFGFQASQGVVYGGCPPGIKIGVRSARGAAVRVSRYVAPPALV